MLLGDSITQITCWRPKVWSQLSSAGLSGSVDFVGSASGLGPECGAPPAGFDPDHEGHSGWQAYDIARNNIAGWVQSTKPDILQFMLGTNDVNIGKRGVQAILDAYTTILSATRSVNPNVKVIIDKLIPTSWSDATIESVNSAIPAWASQHSTAASPVAVADCSRAAGFTNAMLQQDGVHPNDLGDQFIAQQVGPKLLQAIQAVRGGGGGGSTPVATTTTLRTSTTTVGGGGGAPAPTGIALQCMRSAGGTGGRTFRLYVDLVWDTPFIPNARIKLYTYLGRMFRYYANESSTAEPSDLGW
ncbi:cellulose-binding protein [Apiospora phragmitis]|uniref:Cellulose-binding protein n=1 Tax=Apiospora phragmitis TaxID=2905665 RepID=A0ABR1VXG1_9PEZI